MQRACSVCGVEFPRTSEYWHRGGCSDGFSSSCRECASSRTRAWHAAKYQRHPRPVGESKEAREHRLAHLREWQAEHREELKATRKAWYEAHKGDPEFKAKKGVREKAWLSNAANRESKVAYRKAHHKAKRDHDNATNRAWYAANREQRCQQIKAYGTAHADELREYRADWARLNYKERYAKARAWVADHPDLVRSYSQRRRALELGATGSFTAEDLQAQHAKQLGLCFYCGRSLDKRFEADHYIPLSRGGSNEAENIVLACRSSNRSKCNKLPEEFLRRLRRAPRPPPLLTNLPTSG